MVDVPQIVVDATGIAAPTREDYLSYLQEVYRDIYGQDIYLGNDSQDGQLVGILARALSDTADSAVAVYNDFSPATAQGAGLDSVIKVNGIRRQIPTFSTVVVTVTGPVGRQITDGVAGDNLSLDTRWALPATVTIPTSGSIDVTATSTAAGAVVAAPHTITNILTPQPSWHTVDNASSSATGAPVESEAALRSRQSRSASLPAATTLNGIFAAVGDVDGVERLEVYQNDTNTDSAEGLPAHNIAVVVKGGDAAAIGSAIALKKPPGIPMAGTVTVEVFDTRGVPSTIKYYPLRTVTQHVVVWLSALPGYVTSTGDMIRSSIIQHYDDQGIGEDSYLSRLYAPANLVGGSAQTATGLSASQLQAVSDTYHVTTLAQGDEDMVADGAFPAGSTVISVISVIDFSAGELAYISLNDGSYHRVTISSVSVLAGTITFSPAIPIGKSVLDGAYVYVIGDVFNSFSEAATAISDDIDVIAT